MSNILNISDTNTINSSDCKYIKDVFKFTEDETPEFICLNDPTKPYSKTSILLMTNKRICKANNDKHRSVYLNTISAVRYENKLMTNVLVCTKVDGSETRFNISSKKVCMYFFEHIKNHVSVMSNSNNVNVLMESHKSNIMFLNSECEKKINELKLGHIRDKENSYTEHQKQIGELKKCIDENNQKHKAEIETLTKNHEHEVRCINAEHENRINELKSEHCLNTDDNNRMFQAEIDRYKLLIKKIKDAIILIDIADFGVEVRDGEPNEVV